MLLMAKAPFDDGVDAKDFLLFLKINSIATVLVDE